MTQMTTTTTTTTMRTRLAHRGPALKGCMENPQASESHHYYRHQRRRGRGRRQQRSAPHWQKFKSSEPSWPRRAPTPPQRLRLRLSVSRMDLAGALIDFVPVRIVYYHAQTQTHTHTHTFSFWLACRCGCSSDAAATWCFACQSEQGCAQGDGSGVCER